MMATAARNSPRLAKPRRLIMDVVSLFSALLDDGGFVMPPLLGCAFLIWFGLGERYLTLRRGDARSTRALFDAASKGEALHCRGLIDTAAYRLGSAVHQHGAMGVHRAENLVQDLVNETDRHVQLVKTLVVIAPLAGLLGTVSGMMETFASLSEMALFAQSGGIAGGIAEALLTTQMGLAVAIPGIIVGRMMEKMARKRLAELTELKVWAAEGGLT